MAPRSSKKTKVTDTRNSSSSSSSNNGGDKNNPVVVVAASSSRVVESTATAVGIVHSLHDTKTETEAIKSMDSLEIFLKSEKNCQEFFELEGTSAIYSVIHRFENCETFVDKALDVLYFFIDKIPKASNVLIRLEFHVFLISLAATHADSKQIQQSSTLLFYLLALYLTPQSKRELGTKEIIQFMKNSMIPFPEDMDIVGATCSYFYRMSKIPDLNKLLLENDVFVPLSAAFQKIYEWENDGIDRHMFDKMIAKDNVINSSQALANLIKNLRK